MADESRSSKKRKRGKRRGPGKNKDSTNNIPDVTKPHSQDVVVSGSSDGTISQRVSGSSSFLDKVRIPFVSNSVLKSIALGNLGIY